MESAKWMRMRALFEGALDVEPGEREAWLVRAADGDHELVREVSALLRAEARSALPLSLGPSGLAGDALEAGGDLQLGPVEMLAEQDDTQRRGYILEAIIGRGGSGTIYAALQRSTGRRVALKTLAYAAPSRPQLERFRLEGGILATLRHRAIAQVLDAGLLDRDGAGVPFIALELVEGARDLVRYAQGLPLARRLELVHEACMGLHHAHRNGIIHRDVKPGNLLVDQDGQVKVIDFGLARIIEDGAERGPGARSRTREGSVLGTLDYMSPEHVAGLPQDVDVRSDVYSLGCVVFELLAGRPPRRLADLTLTQALSAVASTPPDLGLLRQQGVPAALRAIVGKCLAQRPADRYATARELALDLERFLRSERVLAMEGRSAATIVAFARRQRVALSATLAVFAALSIGLLQARTAARRAVLARDEARAEAETAGAVARFLGDTLAAVNPFREGVDVKVIDLLAHAETTLPELADERARAIVRGVVGQGMLGLGQHERAIVELRGALAALEGRIDLRNPTRLQLVAALADALELNGKYADSLALTRETLPVAIEVFGPADRTTRYLRVNEGVCLTRLGDEAGALAAYERVLALDAAHATARVRDTVSVMERSAVSLIALGRGAEARQRLELGLQRLRDAKIEGSMDETSLRSTLAQLLQAEGEYDAAYAEFVAVLEQYERRGALAGNILPAALNVAQLALALGRPGEAREVLAEREAVLRAHSTEPTRHTWFWRFTEARIALEEGDLARAIELARAATAIGRELAPSGWPQEHYSLSIEGTALARRGDLDGALAALDAGAAALATQFGETSDAALEPALVAITLLAEADRKAEAAARRAAALERAARIEDAARRARWDADLRAVPVDARR
ncbi:MAG: protein kinase [Planctomycetota bacterium]